MRLSHPLHPALVHFPIACWTLAACADVMSLWLGERAWWVAGVLHLAGTGSAVAAMLAGLLELSRLPEAGPSTRVVEWHMRLVISAWLLFAASLMLRMEQAHITAPGYLEIALSCMGWIVLMGACWCGGQLVYRHGIGVRDHSEGV